MSTPAKVDEPVVVCPKCSNPIPLTRALTGPIEAQVVQRLEAEYRNREREKDAAVERRIAEAVAGATRKLKSEQGLEVKNLREQVAEQQVIIGKLEEDELALRKRAREVQAREKALNLEIERQVDERAKTIEAEASRRLSEAHRLKDAEKDKKLADLRRQLEEAILRAQQGSQQLKGEVAELDLEAQLGRAFATDVLEPIMSGQRGADVLQRIVDGGGLTGGSILYEVKTAKTFSESWIQKLREDQRAQSADIAVLVTVVLPKDVSTFAFRGGVWVVGLPMAVALAHALRHGLLEVGRARVVADGQAEKQANLLAYVGGTEFRQRIEGMLDPIIGSLDDLNKERRAIETNWARRQKRLEQLVKAVGGLYGDFGGIIGTLPKLARLELPAGDGDGSQAA